MTYMKQFGQWVWEAIWLSNLTDVLQDVERARPALPVTHQSKLESLIIDDHPGASLQQRLPQKAERLQVPRMS